MQREEEKIPKKLWHIYCAINTCNGKAYVGQTMRSIRERWLTHVRDAVRGIGHCIYLCNAINKYGANSFQIEEIGVAYSQEEANKLEHFAIAFMRTTDSKYGYNIKGGGRSVFSISPQARERMRLATTRTDVDTNEIIKLYRAGVPAKDIASRFKIDDSTVFFRLHKAGAEVRPPTREGFRGMSKEAQQRVRLLAREQMERADIDTEELITLCNLGYTTQQIADKVGASYMLVYKRLSKRGYKPTRRTKNSDKTDAFVMRLLIAQQFIEHGDAPPSWLF